MKPTYKLLLWLLLLCGRSAVVSADADVERIFRPITASNGLADNSAQTIKCTLTGRMTISTIGNINFYDGANFSHINTADEFFYKLEDYQGHYHLYYDNDHHLWLKSSRGVSCVNLRQERYVTNIDSIFVQYGATKRVDDMFVDQDGNLWLCTEKRILSLAYHKRVRLEQGLNLQDMEVIDKRYLFLFYENGLLACYDLKAGCLLYRNRAYGAADAATYARSMVQLVHDGGFYIIRNGQQGAILLRYDIAGRRWSVVMRSDYHLNNMVVHDGTLYIASEWGYFTYDLGTGATVHHKELLLRSGRRLSTDINAIEFDLQGGMWLGTEQRGLLYGRPLNAPFQKYDWTQPEAFHYEAMMSGLKGISEFRGKKANVCVVDSRHWTWVGTPNGLYLYTSPQVEPVVFSTKNGLLNSVIHSVIEDDAHNIWASTSYGISCIKIRDGKVKQVFCFNDDDNVPNETFINAKAMKLPDGQIVMQALDHVVKFDPARFDSLLDQKAYELKPKLTKLLVNGIDVSTTNGKVDGNTVLDRAITRTKEMNLNYDQNSLSLTFSALNYARPLQTYYRIRVREISKDWIEYSYFSGSGLVDGKGLLHLPLTGLKPGTYHIELLASVVPGQFVGHPYEWIINVNEPWWRQAGVMIAFGLIVLAMAVLNFIVFNRNTRLKMRRNNEEGDVVRRIAAFVERCDNFSRETMSPTQEEIYGTDQDSQTELNGDFVEVMLKVIPYVHERGDRPFTMHMLSRATDMDLLELYDMVSENIHKSPRALVCSMRISEVAEQLRTTDKGVEQIARDCGFVSPNYMMAKFFHKFKMTPDEFRRELEQ